MPRNSWTSLLASMKSDGTAVTGTTEGSLLTTEAKIALGSREFQEIGQGLRVRAMGRISNVVTTPGNITFRFKFGSIIIATSGTLNLNVVAKTNVTWILDWDILLRSAGGGTTATVMHSGQWQSESVVGSPAAGAGGASSHIFPASAPAVGTGFDSTISNIIDFTAQFSVTGNSIQAHTYKLESLN